MTTKSSSCNILIITPLFFNDASGAAVYYQMLASNLIKKDIVVSIISDREYGVFKGNYYPIFPKRSGQDKRKWLDLALYAIQNITYFKIKKIIEYEAPDTIIVHTSFYNHIGLFPYFINNMMNRFKKINWIADARDHLIPKKMVLHLSKYKNVISCSKNVSTYLVCNYLDANKIINIPVLQEKINSSKITENEALKNEILKYKYILHVGSIKEEKGVDILLNSFIYEVHPLLPNYKLILVGLLKSDNIKIRNMLSHKSVEYLGNIPRQSVLTLMRYAELCVNISPNEGMPRSSLEALALKRPTLLPPNVPEFKKHCAEFVVSDTDPFVVGQRIIKALASQLRPQYPIEEHYIDNVLPRYLELISTPPIQLS